MPSFLWISLLPAILASVTVYSPESLHEAMLARYPEGFLPSSLAPFGNPPYGTSIIGKVHIGVEERQGHCGSLQRIEFHEEVMAGSSPILLVQRGTCSYANRVKHSQSIGAKAVLVIHNQSEDIESVHLLPGADTHDLAIPSFLISLSDGQLIRKEIERGEEVTMILSFHERPPSNFVEYTIWMTSGSLETLDFLAKFAPIADRFAPTEARVDPHFVLWYCSSCKTENYTKSAPNCLSGGRYCAPDPDGDGPYTGRDTVLEDLREICLLNVSRTHWFDYVVELRKRCWDGAVLQKCSWEVMDRWEGVAGKVEKCVKNSAEGGGDISVVDNSLLRSEQHAWNTHGSGYFPSIKINNVVYRGYWDPERLREAICDEFDSPPPACHPSIASTLSRSISLFSGVLVLCGVLLALCGVLCISRLLMKREMRREMKQQVNAAVSQYISLSNTSFAEDDQH